MGADDNDILPAYAAFVIGVGVIGIGFALALLTARCYHHVSLTEYLQYMFRAGKQVDAPEDDGSQNQQKGGQNGNASYDDDDDEAIQDIGSTISGAGRNNKNPFKQPAKYREHKTETTNIFKDITIPIARVVFLGSGQLLLLCMWIWSLYDSGRPNFQTRSYTFYFLGVFITMIYIMGNDMQHKRRLDRDYWSMLFHHIHNNDNSSSQSLGRGSSRRRTSRGADSGHFLVEEDESAPVKVTGFEADVRYFFDCVINSAGLGLLTFGIPIQLAFAETPFDFVLNVLAAFFIIELDDADDKSVCPFLVVGDSNEGEHHVEEETEKLDVSASGHGGGGTRRPPTQQQQRETFQQEATSGDEGSEFGGDETEKLEL